MKIEKYKYISRCDKFYYYYEDSQTYFRIHHGLDNYSWRGIGYWYHDEMKGFWLRKIVKPL